MHTSTTCLRLPCNTLNLVERPLAHSTCKEKVVIVVIVAGYPASPLRNISVLAPQNRPENAEGGRRLGLNVADALKPRHSGRALQAELKRRAGEKSRGRTDLIGAADGRVKDRQLRCKQVDDLSCRVAVDARRWQRREESHLAQKDRPWSAPRKTRS
jgi:hypothetical protein